MELCMSRPRARTQTYKGVAYDSGLEVRCAQRLDALMKTTPPLVAAWEAHHPGMQIILFPRAPGQRKTATQPAVPTIRQASYCPDFRLTPAAASPHYPASIYVESKGYATDVFKLRMRILKHMRPDVVLYLVHHEDELVGVLEGRAKPL